MKNTLCLLVTLLLASSISAQEHYFQRLVTEFPLDAENGIDPEAWSDAEAIDSKTCRKLLKGKKGQLTIPVWWGTSDRPDKQNNALAEIVFQDTSPTAIRVNLFAGLPGEIEIHRIGGLGDNKWKTALVPIPWDQIIRFKDTNNTAVTIYAPKDYDVPVYSISIKKGNPNIDEQRWAAETRAWVSREQAEKRKKATLPPAEQAQLTDAVAQQQVVCYARPMTRLLYPNSAPQKTDRINKISLSLAQNEMEGAQFALYAPQADLKNISVACGSLNNSNGATLNATIELYTVEYALVTSKSDQHPIYPQRLWPQFTTDIKAKETQSYWLNIESHRGKTLPGTYTGKLDILSDGTSIGQADIHVEILPIDLLTMKEAGLHLGGCVPKFIPAHELKELSRYNHNSINLWYSGTWLGKPILKNKDDFDINLWVWDDFMKHASDAGVENFIYFLGGNPYGYPDTMHLERDLYRFAYTDSEDLDTSRTAWLKSFWAAEGKVAPEIRDLYKQWIHKFYTHAHEHGWPEPIVTPFDERAKWTQESWARGKQYRWLNDNGKYSFRVVPDRKSDAFFADMKKKGIKPEYVCDGGAGPWIKTHFKDCAALIHEAYPKARVYGSIHHAKDGLPFLEDVEVFCTNAIHQDHDLGNKVRAVKNKTFWEYSGTNDKREPVVARFTFGVYFGAFNSRGSLVWAYNWGSRFNTASSGNQWMYAWTTPYSLVRTPYLEGLREGFDDRRYMETLLKLAKDKGKEQEAQDLLQGIFKQVVGSRTKKGHDTVHNFFAQTNDPEKLSKYRQQIIDKILSLQ